MDALFSYETCMLCPRRCGVNRTRGEQGWCGMGAQLKIARSALHFWEEPSISGDRGSGAIFFSGCSLRCVYCQNHEISHEKAGLYVSTTRLANMMLELEAQGAHNINLVTATHFSAHVCEAIFLARNAGLSVPIVYNTSGYELKEQIEMLADAIDIWLVDYKYASPKLAWVLSGAADYPEVAYDALASMCELIDKRGGRVLDNTGIMQQGIIVRHLVLPGHSDDSCAVLDRVWELCGSRFDVSIMNQYTPNSYCKAKGGALARGLSNEEYEFVLTYADKLGFENLMWQEGGTVSESFVPAFDMSGVEGPELKV